MAYRRFDACVALTGAGFTRKDCFDYPAIDAVDSVQALRRQNFARFRFSTLSIQGSVLFGFLAMLIVFGAQIVPDARAAAGCWVGDQHTGVVVAAPLNDDHGQTGCAAIPSSTEAGDSGTIQLASMISTGAGLNSVETPGLLRKVSDLANCPKSTSTSWHNCNGTKKYKGGDTYSGEYQNGKRHGQGTYKWASGSKYVGQYREGQRTGHGSYFRSNGDSYVGEYKEGDRHGTGTYTWANGDKYVGSYKNNKRNGQGTFIWADGEKYVGDYVDGKRSGFGIYTRVSGEKYVGGYKDSKREGFGTRYAADGTILQRGIFKNGSFVKAQDSGQSQVAKVEPKPIPNVVTANDNKRKVALVIGNEAYAHAVPLNNPKNDARAVGAMLTRLGFQVFSGTDLGHGAMNAVIRDFAAQARTADIALAFYAGHAIQVAGQNYMVPIDARVADSSSVDFELINVSKVTNYIGGIGKVGIFLLDACRDNPFTRSLARSLGTRSSQVGRGLAPISSEGGGLLIGYATAAGDVASDGQGHNSPFTTALLEHLPTQNLEIQSVMTRVKATVIKMTNNNQRPWHNSDLALEVFVAGR